jgi:hypothetical protein
MRRAEQRRSEPGKPGKPSPSNVHSLNTTIPTIPISLLGYQLVSQYYPIPTIPSELVGYQDSTRVQAPMPGSLGLPQPIALCCNVL